MNGKLLLSSAIGSIHEGWAYTVRRTVDWRVHPNTITVAGTGLQLFTAWVFSTGYWTTAGILLIFAGLLDALDGAVARQSGKETAFGAFLDSTLDRISDLALFAGVMACYAFQWNWTYAGLAFYGGATAVLISYSKARAENLITDCKVGLAQRPERIALLAVAGIFHSMGVGLWLIAVFNTLTLIERILYTYQRTSRRRIPAQDLQRIVFLDFDRESPAYAILALICLLLLVLGGIA